MIFEAESISLKEYSKICAEIEKIDKSYGGCYVPDHIYIYKPVWYNIPRRVILMNKILREVL